MTGPGSRGTCIPLLLLAAFFLQSLPLPSAVAAGQLSPASWSVSVEAPDAPSLGAECHEETAPATGVWLAFAGRSRSSFPRPDFTGAVLPAAPLRLSGRQATPSPALPRPPPFA